MLDPVISHLRSNARRYFRALLVASTVVALAYAGTSMWSAYDYQRRTEPLLEKLRHEMDSRNAHLGSQAARFEQHSSWQREAADTLQVAADKVQSALRQDEAWRRRQEWFQHWLEQRRPEPDLKWAIDLARWIAALERGIARGENPFVGPQTGDRLRVFRLGTELVPYRVYVPSNYQPGDRLPVVIGFHSRDGDENLFFHAFDGSALKRAADAHRFVFVGTTQGGPLGRCSDPHSKAVVQELVRILAERDDVDIRNLFFLGHSRGGPAALHCAIDMPDKVRAIAVMAPSLSVREFDRIEVLRDIPIMYVAGERDSHYTDNARNLQQVMQEKAFVRMDFHLEPREDHFFTRGTDHEMLFRRIFSFFASSIGP